MDMDYEEKRSKQNRGPPSCSSGTFALKEGQKEAFHHVNSILPSTSSSSGKEWNRLPSPTTSQPCLWKNLLSEKLADGGTDAGMFGDIMKLENETRRSLYLEMRFQRWEKPLTNKSPWKGGIPADVIVGRLKSKLSRM
jgi:hypothetical protein